MGDIQTVSVKLVDSEKGLEKSVQEIDFVTKQVQTASNQIASNSEKQNEDMADASANMEEINNLIASIAVSVEQLNKTSKKMQEDGRNSMEIMEEVMKEAENQKDNMEQTQVHFQKVGKGIEASLHEIIEIGKQAEVCDAEKDKVTRHIEALKVLAEESVASARDTQQLVNGLSRCIANTGEIAVLLKEYANTLDGQISYFVTEG